MHSVSWDNFINLLSILNNRFWRSANLLYNVHNPSPLSYNHPPPLSDLANPSFGSGLAQPLKALEPPPCALRFSLLHNCLFQGGCGAGGGSTTYLQQSHSFISPLLLPSLPPLAENTRCAFYRIRFMRTNAENALEKRHPPRENCSV